MGKVKTENEPQKITPEYSIGSIVRVEGDDDRLKNIPVKDREGMTIQKLPKGLYVVTGTNQTDRSVTNPFNTLRTWITSFEGVWTQDVLPCDYHPTNYNLCPFVSDGSVAESGPITYFGVPEDLLEGMPSPQTRKSKKLGNFIGRLFHK
jgi:hypothetical protein